MNIVFLLYFNRLGWVKISYGFRYGLVKAYGNEEEKCEKVWKTGEENIFPIYVFGFFKSGKI